MTRIRCLRFARCSVH